MTRRCAVVLFALVSLSGLVAAGVSLLRSWGAVSPSVVPVGQPDYDFGEVAEGTPVTHEFVLLNRGNRFLQISAATGSCPCLECSVSVRRVAPGDRCLLSTTLETTALSGRVKYSCYVAFADVPPMRFTLKGYVFSRTAVFSSNRIDFGDILVGTTAARSLRITNPDYRAAKWKITSVESRSPGMTADYIEKSGEINCTFGPVAVPREVSGYLSIGVASDAAKSSIRIPVSGQVVGPLKAVPGALFLGRVHRGQLCERPVRILQISDEPGMSVKSLLSAAGLEVKRAQGREYECVVRIQAPETYGVFLTQIVVRVAEDEKQWLRIPLSGYVADDR